MYATDFIYDSLKLSDFGFMIADIGGSSGITNVDVGAPITFSTISRRGGRRFSLTNVTYESALEITFSICKNPCDYTDFVITDEEYFSLMRWLYRREFLDLCFIDDDCIIPRHYVGGFDVTKIQDGGVLVGLELKLTTDKPYAYGDTMVVEHTFTANSTWSFLDTSMVVGEMLPKFTITCNGAGTLRITNALNSQVMEIKDCISGEVITIDSENCIIESSNSSHDLWNDFNYVFLKLENTYDERKNPLTSTLPCTLAITYNPIIVDSL